MIISSRQREEAERPAKSTASGRPAKSPHRKAVSTHAAANSEFVSLPESWLDRVRLGFPRANSW
jgi:hypothetical protein